MPVLATGSVADEDSEDQRVVTIDERLEKLTERHEALTQTVELLAREVSGMHSYVKDIAEATARLLHIAQIHEHRITRLEGESPAD